MGMLMSFVPGGPKLWDIPTKGINLKSSQFLGLRSLLYGTKGSVGGRMIGALAGGSMFGLPGGIFGFAFGDMLSQQVSGKGAGLFGAISPAIETKHAARLAEGTFFGVGRKFTGITGFKELTKPTFAPEAPMMKALKNMFGFKTEEQWMKLVESKVKLLQRKGLADKFSVDTMKDILADPNRTIIGAEAAATKMGLPTSLPGGRREFLKAIETGTLNSELFVGTVGKASTSNMQGFYKALNKNIAKSMKFGQSEVENLLRATMGPGPAGAAMQDILTKYGAVAGGDYRTAMRSAQIMQGAGLPGAQGRSLAVALKSSVEGNLPRILTPDVWKRTGAAVSEDLVKRFQTAVTSTSAFQTYLAEELPRLTSKVRMFGEFSIGTTAGRGRFKAEVKNLFFGPKGGQMADATARFMDAQNSLQSMVGGATKGAAGVVIPGAGGAAAVVNKKLMRQVDLTTESQLFRVGTSYAIKGVVGYLGAKWLIGKTAGLVKSGVETLERGAAIARQVGKMEFGSGRALVTPLATTERTRAIQAIQNSGINARQYLGREANMYAE
jgi:hypothetical protein